MDKRIKDIILYNVNPNREESMLYSVSLTGLWRRSIRSQYGSNHTTRVIINVLHRPYIRITKNKLYLFSFYFLFYFLI